MVASHTAVPLGTAKWLERAIPTPVTLPLGKGQGLLMSPTQGQADIIGSNSIPAISQPLWGQLYGWLPLSNAYGISSGEKQPISIILRLFLALENKAHSMYIGIFLHHKTKYIQCTSAFTCITKQYTPNKHPLLRALKTHPIPAGISFRGKTKYA